MRRFTALRLLGGLAVLAAVLALAGLNLGATRAATPTSAGAVPPARAQTGPGGQDAAPPGKGPPLQLPPMRNAPAALGDPLFTINVAQVTTPPDDIALGVQYALGYFWATGRNSTDNIKRLWKLTTSGAQVAVYVQDSCPASTFGWRDLAFDGTYLYAADECGVDRIDPATGARVGGFANPTGLTIARALAYDPATSHFYGANFNSSIVVFDHTGAVVSTIPADGLSHYGFGWDSVSPGGPYLWSFSQDGPNSLQATRLNPSTGAPTGVQFNPPRIGTTDIAGGADVTDQLGYGTLVLVAMHQTDANAIRGYDLAVPLGGTPTRTVTGTPPTATRTGTATPCPVQNYQVTSSTGATVVPATTFVPGSNCDDCSNAVSLPFPFQLYGQTFTTVNAVSNGNLQFNSAAADFTNACLPFATFNYAILPHWDDLVLTGTGQGIYTLLEGTAPNRVFDIEWRGGYFSGVGTVDFEVRLFENSRSFQVIYGTVTQSGSSATVGVQRDTGSLFTQYECNTGSLSSGQMLTFSPPPCGSVTGTPVGSTPTRTSTPGGTPTRTGTPGTATATVTCGPIVVMGSIDGTEPVKDSVNGVAPSQCGTPACPGDLPGAFHYDAYTFTNTTGAPTCITVALDDTSCGSGESIYSDAYLGSFDPNDGCANYLGDSGAPGGTYQFTVPAGGTFIVVIEEYNQNGGCVSYTATISGLNPCPGGTVTPPAGASNTAVPPTRTRTATVVPSATTAPSSTVIPASNTPAAASSTPAAASRTPVPATRTAVVPSVTPVRATHTPGPSPTPCPISFSDVHATDYFYVPVQYLYCHGVISGYADGTFRPYANTTRSQMVKIVVLGFQMTITAPSRGAYTFSDVPPANPFFGYIETAAARNIVSGYNCGGPGEPCDSQNRPYFRPFANVTRGQLSKIDVVAAGWTLVNPTNRTFEDVLPNTAFYAFVETASCHGIISGYTCGGPGEPCDAANRPYFRQFADATRGQIAKIVYLSITGSGSQCAVTPAR